MENYEKTLEKLRLTIEAKAEQKSKELLKQTLQYTQFEALEQMQLKEIGAKLYNGYEPKQVVVPKTAEAIINIATQKQNNYVKQPVRGILKDVPKSLHKKDNTKFKLVVWYNLKTNGMPYSIVEKNNNLNRKYHDSIDFVPSQTIDGIEYITRHDLAFEKLFNHLTYYSCRIDKALMFVNDWINEEQLTIINWHNDINRTKFVNPLFKQYCGQVFYDGLSCPALKVDKLTIPN